MPEDFILSSLPASFPVRAQGHQSSGPKGCLGRADQEGRRAGGSSPHPLFLQVLPRSGCWEAGLCLESEEGADGHLFCVSPCSDSYRRRRSGLGSGQDSGMPPPTSAPGDSREGSRLQASQDSASLLQPGVRLARAGELPPLRQAPEGLGVCGSPHGQGPSVQSPPTPNLSSQMESVWDPWGRLPRHL